MPSLCVNCHLYVYTAIIMSIPPSQCVHCHLDEYTAISMSKQPSLWVNSHLNVYTAISMCILPSLWILSSLFVYCHLNVPIIESLWPVYFLQTRIDHTRLERMSDCWKKFLNVDGPHRFLFESIVAWILVCLPVNIISLCFGIIAPQYDHNANGNDNNNVSDYDDRVSHRALLQKEINNSFGPVVNQLKN